MKLIIITKIIIIIYLQLQHRVSFCNHSSCGVKKSQAFWLLSCNLIISRTVIINTWWSETFQNHQDAKEQTAVLLISANVARHTVCNQPMIGISDNSSLLEWDLNIKMLLLFCARPGALLGGTRSCAGESRQQRYQRFRQDDWLPEPGPGGLAA